MSAITPDAAPAGISAEAAARAARHWGVPIALGVLGLVSFLAFGLGTPSGAHTTFALSRGSDAVAISPFAVPSRATAIVFSVITLLAAAYAPWRVYVARKIAWCVYVIYGFSLMTALLSWAGA